MSEVEVVKADASHLDAILSIAHECNLGHWTKNDYQTEVENQNAILLVARTNSKTIGFVLARLITPAVEIMNIGVLAVERRRGIGDFLLISALFKAKAQNIEECWLEVRASNQGAQKFYLKNNFRIVGTRRNYYVNPVENAVLMSLTL